MQIRTHFFPKSNTTFDVNTGAPPDRVPLSLREAAPAWTAIVALTVLAWIVTLDQVRAMGNGAGTMGMSFVAFVAMWTAMMAAISLAPDHHLKRQTRRDRMRAR